MPSRFYIKQGDTGRVLGVTLVGGNGAPQDLTGAVVRFRMRPEGNAAALATVNALAQVIDALRGRVSYSFVAGDTAVAGTYDGEFVATWGDREVTFPTAPSPDDFIKVVVQRDVRTA